MPETCGAQRPGVEQGGGKKGGGTEECWAVLDTACKTPLHFALGYLTTSSRATPHPVANIQPLSLGHLSPNMCSHSFVPLPMRFPCAGIPFPPLSTWGTPAQPSGPSPNVTSSGKPSLLLRKDESFPPCAPTAFVLISLDTEAQLFASDHCSSPLSEGDHPFILAPQNLPSTWQLRRCTEGVGTKCLGPSESPWSQVLSNAALHAFPLMWERLPSLKLGLSSLRAGEGKLVGAVLNALRSIRSSQGLGSGGNRE